MVEHGAPRCATEFEDWHSHEHFPERLAIPGFRRASRWTSATEDDGVFVMYELQGYEVLSSPAYLASLNAPSPWSTRMMPHHRNMVRCQARVLESRGTAVARQALTMRLSPAPGRDDDLRAALRSLVEHAADAARPDGRPSAAPRDARRSRRRPSRRSAAPIRSPTGSSSSLGYDPAALDALAHAELAEPSLVALGAAPGAISGRFALSSSATPADMA